MPGGLGGDHAVLKALKDADVKIINVDAQVKEMEYVDAYIGSDNQNAGYICGEDLIEKAPDGRKGGNP